MGAHTHTQPHTNVQLFLFFFGSNFWASMPLLICDCMMRRKAVDLSLFTQDPVCVCECTKVFTQQKKEVRVRCCTFAFSTTRFKAVISIAYTNPCIASPWFLLFSLQDARFRIHMAVHQMPFSVTNSIANFGKLCEQIFSPLISIIQQLFLSRKQPIKR